MQEVTTEHESKDDDRDRRKMVSCGTESALRWDRHSKAHEKKLSCVTPLRCFFFRTRTFANAAEDSQGKKAEE